MVGVYSLDAKDTKTRRDSQLRRECRETAKGWNSFDAMDAKFDLMGAKFDRKLGAIDDKIEAKFDAFHRMLIFLLGGALSTLVGGLIAAAFTAPS